MQQLSTDICIMFTQRDLVEIPSQGATHARCIKTVTSFFKACLRVFFYVYCVTDRVQKAHVIEQLAFSSFF